MCIASDVHTPDQITTRHQGDGGKLCGGGALETVVEWFLLSCSVLTWQRFPLWNMAHSELLPIKATASSTCLIDGIKMSLMCWCHFKGKLQQFQLDHRVGWSSELHRLLRSFYLHLRKSNLIMPRLTNKDWLHCEGFYLESLGKAAFFLKLNFRMKYQQQYLERFTHLYDELVDDGTMPSRKRRKEKYVSIISDESIVSGLTNNSQFKNTLYDLIEPL